MSTEVILPKLGFAMSEGSIAEWMATEGATVTAGAPLYTIESDKSIQEIEAPASGVLRIVIQPGEVHPVGTVIGVIE